MMQRARNYRISDKSARLNLGESTFVVRKNTPIQAVTHLLLICSAIVAAVTILLYYDSIMGVILPLVTAGIVGYIGIQFKDQEALQESSEFLNAVFSSAISAEYKFCAVLHRGGEMVYMNLPFQAMFSTFMEQPIHNLETFFRLHDVAPEQSLSVKTLVESGPGGAFPVLFGASGAEPSRLFSISVSPIDRHKDLVLLRGK